jgi:hypothetical protein
MEGIPPDSEIGETTEIPPSDITISSSMPQPDPEPLAQLPQAPIPANLYPPSYNSSITPLFPTNPQFNPQYFLLKF